MKQQFKLIAIDVDGTLLNSRHELTSRTARALRTAIDQGIHIVLATGKMYVGIEALVVEFGLESPQITSGGAVITQRGTQLLRLGVPRPLAEEVINLAEAMAMTMIVLRDGLTFAAEMNADTAYMETFGDPHPTVVNPLTDCLEPEPTQMYLIAYRQDERFQEAVQVFEQAFGDRLSVRRSSPYFLEFVHKEASKGNALKMVSKLVGVGREAMLAIGDSHNDLSMFAYAGYAVAMGQSAADVQQAATTVTASNDEDGVAKAIEELVLRYKLAN